MVYDKSSMLTYCLLGNANNITKFGHEYIKSLSSEIILSNKLTDDQINLLIDQILPYQLLNKYEYEAIDLLIELNKYQRIAEIINIDNYKRVLQYLNQIILYLNNDVEHFTKSYINTLYNISLIHYMKYHDYTNALLMVLKMKVIIQ